MRLKILFLSLFVFITTLVNAQSSDIHEPIWKHKNSVYAAAGLVSLYGAYSINYERLVFQQPIGFVKGVWARTGFGEWAAYGAGGSHSIFALTALTGKRKGHFEVGLGVTRLVDNYDEPFVDVITAPSGTLGYRLQDPSGNFILRAGFSFPESAYFSLGIAF